MEPSSSSTPADADAAGDSLHEQQLASLTMSAASSSNPPEHLQQQPSTLPLPLPPPLPPVLTTTTASGGSTIHHQHSLSGGGGGGSGQLFWANNSAPSSPTAASEYSVTTTHASTSSTIPFSHIAQQRKQQERESALQDAMQTLLTDAAAAFDLRMQCYTQDISALQELNEAAAQQYSSAAEIAAALGQFVSDLSARQAAAKEALAVLPQLDRQLELLATAVSQLDKRSRQLESKLGLKPLSASSGSSSSSYSAYEYIAQSVSQLTAVGVSTATAGLGCLGSSVGTTQGK